MKFALYIQTEPIYFIKTSLSSVVCSILRTVQVTEFISMSSQACDIG